MAAEHPFTEAVRNVRQAREAAVAAKTREAEIGRDARETDKRLAALEEALGVDAREAAFKGPPLDPKVAARRRAEIEDVRGQLVALEEAKPMAAAASREADAEHAAAQRDLSAIALPHIHREQRLPAVAAFRGCLKEVAARLAAIKAADLTARRIAGDEPYVHSIPEGYFFAEPLIDKLISAIPPQFGDRDAISRSVAEMAAVIAKDAISRLEASGGGDTTHMRLNVQDVRLRARTQLSVLAGYTISGAKLDGTPKLKAHSRDVSAGEIFTSERKIAEQLIREGLAHLVVDGEELI